MLGFVVGRKGFFRDHPLKAASTITDLHKFVVFRKELCSDDVPVLAWQLEAGRSPGAIVEDLRGTCKGIYNGSFKGSHLASAVRAALCRAPSQHQRFVASAARRENCEPKGVLSGACTAGNPRRPPKPGMLETLDPQP